MGSIKSMEKTGRFVSSIAFGIAFFAITLLLCFSWFPFLYIASVTSPLYLWRFFHCEGVGAGGIVMLEASIPFLIYGAIVGFFVNARPAISLRYAGAVFSCFALVFFLVFLTVHNYDRQDCNAQSVSSID